MKLMNQIIILMMFVFVLTGCEYLSLHVNDEEKVKDISKEELLDVISGFKESLYKVGASNYEDLDKKSSLTDGDSSIVHFSDELVESNMNVGYDLEWLDMAVFVLDFAEQFTSASDTSDILYEETFFYDVLDDPDIWGWKIYDSTKVILSYTDEVLYLRVIDNTLIQTFFFEYFEEDLIRILRFFEQVTPNGNSLYLEDFIESYGLSKWDSNGEYFLSSRVTAEDGGLYTIMSSGSGEKSLAIANYVIDDVPLYIAEKTNDTLYVEYDFKYVNVFDSFNEGGVLFLNDEIVEMPLEMNARKAYHGADTYVLTGSRKLSELTTLEVKEAGILSDITYEDIKFNIDSLLSHSELRGISYDYSLGVEVILDELSELLYLDYGSGL